MIAFNVSGSYRYRKTRRENSEEHNEAIDAYGEKDMPYFRQGQQEVGYADVRFFSDAGLERALFCIPR